MCSFHRKKKAIVDLTEGGTLLGDTDDATDNYQALGRDMS
jgi:hypothetical protein